MTIPFMTLSGKLLDLNDIKPDELDLFEIANAIANQGRYNGQTKMYYSVAEHCVNLTRYAKRQGLSIDLQKALLMHDASEAYCGDIVYHLKAELPFFKKIENKILSSVYVKFGIDNSAPIMAEVHRLDRAICKDEMSQLLGAVDPVSLDMGLSPLGIKVKGWSPQEARETFLREAKRLKVE